MQPPQSTLSASVDAAVVQDAESRAPKRLAVGWMLGTFAVYLLIGDTPGIASLPVLIGFILLATGAWALGYSWGVNTFPLQALRARYGAPTANAHRQNQSARLWVVASGVYFVVYGYSLLKLYGATPATFLRVIREPGTAYAKKFDIVDTLAGQTGTKLWLLLILLSILQLPLAPLLGYFWSQLSLPVKLVAAAGVASYVAFFLFIGTMQGLGFLLVGLIAGLLARRYRRSDSGSVLSDAERLSTRRSRRVATVAAVLGATVFLIYMVNAQASRLDTFDITDRYEPNPHVEAVVGRDFARGLAVVLHYPTHGYQGLVLNLDTPFEWTEGRGSSRAVDVYWDQYGGDPVFDRTYPARTQERTGYSATTQWATVYPWLASDFHWFGTLILMVFLGRWTARMWLRTIHFHDPLTLMLFSQLFLFVTFIPANNQVLISQPALIAVVSCVALHLAREFRDVAADRSSAVKST